MSYCEDSNINKSYIVQTVDSSDIFSACTEIYVTNITPCTGDTININSNLSVSGNISGTTFYGDGSQLSGIITTDNYVTGGVYTASTKSLYFTGTTGFTPFSIDVSALLDDTNNYVTGGTYNPSTDIISLFRNDNVTIDITGVTDTFTTGGTYDNGTSLITFVKNDNTSYTVDLSSIDVNDTFVTGSTLNGDSLTIRRNDGVDIVVTGFSQTFTGNTNTTCIGDIYVSNIHSCSPLRINSNDEGNVYFGSTSGITIDILNQRVGIGTTSPSESLDVDGNAIISGTINIGKLGTNPSINNLGIDSIGNVVVGTTGDTDTNTFVTGGTLSSNDLILEKNNGVDVNPINLSGLVSGKTDLTLFNSHTGDTNNPHQTSFSGLTSTAHTHTLSEVTDFNTYSGSVQTQIDGKTDNTDFISHTGDTAIHFTKGDISLSEIGNSAHTHTLSEITDFNTYSGNVQTQLDGKVETILFNSHTGDTNNPHDTSFSNLTSTAHTHTISDVINLQTELDGKLSVSEFNTYSGDVQTQIDGKLDISTFNTYSGNVETELNTKISGATNLSSEGVFAQKNGLDLEFKGVSSTGGTVNISSNSNSVNLEVTFPTDQDKFVSGGTYNTGTQEINFVGNSVDTTFDVNLTSLVSSISGDTFVSGGTLSNTDLILEKNNGINVNPVDLSGLVSGKTDLILFNTHTGDTSNPHQTSFSGLTSTAHTHTISDVINLQNELDGKLNVSEFNTYSGDVQTQIDNKLETSIFNSYTGSVVDVFVSSGNANSVTQQLSFTNTTGGTFNVTNSAALFSDNDVNVTGGTYNPSNGCVTFTTNSGTTFDVCGFVTGITDTFVTGGTLSGTDLVLERSNGIDVSGIDLSSLISGKLDITTFNTYTGDTQTILNSKTDNTDFTSHTGDTTIHYTKSSINLSDLGSSAHTHTISEVINLQSELDGKTDLTLFNSHTGDTSNPHQTSFSSLTSTAHTHTISEVVNLQTELDGKTDNTDFTSHTGDTTIHYTKGSINLSDLGSSAHTHTLSEITDFNTYSGNVQTQLDTKIQNGVNSGGANEVFSGNSGTDLYFRTISGGSNTTISTIGDIIKVDVSVPVDTNTFVTGFTYDGINTFTISRNNGLGDLTSTISVLSGITYYGDGSNLSGISSSDFYVTGGTFSSETLTLDRNDGGSVVVTGFTSQPSLNDGEIFVGDTGNTAQSVAMTGDVNIDNIGVTTIQPDSVTYDKIQDVSQAALLGSSNVSGGTVTEIPTIDLYLTTGSITTLLENTSNWDINGNYTGSTITGTYQGQNHYDGNYFFTAVDDNVWIRLIRG